MTRNIWITGITILLLIAAAYVYFQKPDVLNSISDIIIEKPHTAVKRVKPKTAVYLIADPTGSTYMNYAIPPIDTVFISNLTDIIYRSGGGYLWLSYIDRNSKNNKVEYMKIIAPVNRTARPERFSGETYNEYDKRIKEYEASMKNFTQDSLNNYNTYLSDKKEYLELCFELLNKIYVKGLPDNQWSDVIGSLNAAFYSLNTVQDSSAKKYTVCFSDLQQDTPYLNPKPALNSIPSDIKIIAINPVPGSSKMVTNNVVVLDYPVRVSEYIMKNNRGGI